VGPPQVPGRDLDGPFGRLCGGGTGGFRGARSSAYEATDRTTKLACMGRVGASIFTSRGPVLGTIDDPGSLPGPGKYLYPPKNYRHSQICILR
jgi:hypothetical protein